MTDIALHHGTPYIWPHMWSIRREPRTCIYAALAEAATIARNRRRCAWVSVGGKTVWGPREGERHA